MFEKIYEVTYYRGFEQVGTGLFTDFDLAVQCFMDWKGESNISAYPMKGGQLLGSPLIERVGEGSYNYWGETGVMIYNKIMEKKMNFKEVINALIAGKQIECKLKSSRDGWYLLRTDTGNELYHFDDYNFREKK